jgi:Domain of unknown function (DUF4158)
VKRYTQRAKTAYEHTWKIRDAYGYHPFKDAKWRRKFRAFLHGRARRGRWRCQAVGWLRRHRVLLPGVSVLAQPGASVRQVAEKRLYATVADASLPRIWWRCSGCQGAPRLGAGAAAPMRRRGAGMAKALERGMRSSRSIWAG